MSELENSTSATVGVGVASDRFVAVSVTGDGKVSDPVSVSVDPDSDSLAQLKEFAASLEGKLGTYSRLGLAMPGLIRHDTGRVTYSAGFPEHAQFDIAEEIKKATGKAALIENDANAACFGEFRLGAGRGASNLFYATIGAGVGGALILNGQLWRGSTGFAGEFGYVAINSDGMRLEDVASSGNIVRRTRSRFHQDSTTTLASFDERSLTIADIVGAARDEDDFAVLMLERTGRYIGSAVASVINLLNVERIVLGGELMSAGEVILEPIRDRARELSFGPAFADVKLVIGELGEEASAAGVALLAAENG